MFIVGVFPASGAGIGRDDDVAAAAAAAAAADDDDDDDGVDAEPWGLCRVA